MKKEYKTTFPVVAYDAYTNLPFGTFKSKNTAAAALKITAHSVEKSIKDNSYAVQGYYFKRRDS